MLSVCSTLVTGPTVGTVKEFDERFGQNALEVAQQNDVVFAVVVDPAAVALVRVAALNAVGAVRVENLVERVAVDVAQYNVEVLTERYVAVGVYYQLTEYAVTAQFQSTVFPLVV